MNDFASARALTYSPVAPAPAFGGALFEFIEHSSVTDQFSSPDFEVGNLSGTAGGTQTRNSGRWTVTTSFSTSSKRTHGYLALRLETMMPHLVLDAQRNDGRFGGSSIPMPIAGGQSLSLEGDFDQYFTLHCPRGYERDALYVFTPDLMALLIDETGDLDVEIVDDHLFAYSRHAFDLTSPTLWARLDRIREVIGAKALRQTERYRDERAIAEAASTVAPEGRRLRMGFLGGDGSARNMGLLVGAIFVGVFAFIGVVGFFVLRAAL